MRLPVTQPRAPAVAPRALHAAPVGARHARRTTRLQPPSVASVEGYSTEPSGSSAVIEASRPSEDEVRQQRLEETAQFLRGELASLFATGVRACVDRVTVDAGRLCERMVTAIERFIHC